MRSQMMCLLAMMIPPAASTATPAAEPAARPNIILCMADDQGWGDVGYQGHPHLKTPILDEMAASGLRLDRFYAAAPVCSPTRGSFLTGRHPNRFGCFSWGYTIRPEEVTIAEAAKVAGYRTGHFGKWHLGSVRANNPLSPGENGFDEWISAPNFYENSPLMSHNGKVVQLDGESSEATVKAAYPFFGKAVADQTPFLAVIWFGNPHNPHVPVPELAAPYASLPKAEQNYLAELAGIDRAMGMLRQELTRLGIRDNTLLLYTSDNGPQGGKAGRGSAGGLRGRKGELWEGGIRVPAIIEWPAKIRAARRSSMPCGTVDLYPTVVELTGAKIPHQPRLDGESLVPLIEETMTARRQPLGFWVYPAKGHSTPSDAWLRKQRSEEVDGRLAPPHDPAEAKPWNKQIPLTDRPGHAALIGGNYKLHRIPSKNGTDRFELYNLETDPAESKDLADTHPQQVNRMKAALESWQESVLRSLNGEDYQK